MQKLLRRELEARRDGNTTCEQQQPNGSALFLVAKSDATLDAMRKRAIMNNASRVGIKLPR